MPRFISPILAASAAWLAHLPFVQGFDRKPFEDGVAFCFDIHKYTTFYKSGYAWQMTAAVTASGPNGVHEQFNYPGAESSYAVFSCDQCRGSSTQRCDLYPCSSSLKFDPSTALNAHNVSVSELRVLCTFAGRANNDSRSGDVLYDCSRTRLQPLIDVELQKCFSVVGRPSPSSRPSFSPSPAADTSVSEGGGMGTAEIIGIVTGVVAAVFAVAGFVYKILYYQKKNKRASEKDPDNGATEPTMLQHTHIGTINAQVPQQ